MLHGIRQDEGRRRSESEAQRALAGPCIKICVCKKIIEFKETRAFAPLHIIDTADRRWLRP